jgi:glucan biosynthesis protein
VVVEDNPIDGGWRVVFKLDPGTNELIELRCVLSFDDKRPAEIWTYRWTA